MKPVAILFFIISAGFLSCSSQTTKSNLPTGMSAVANKFLVTLSSAQKARTQFAFTDEERYDWHYIPKTRKGISLGELNDQQKKAAFDLLRTALSDTGYKKARAIMELETVLRQVEGRVSNDDYRDPGKYYFSVFGDPAVDSIWGWRLEGHHVSFNFSTKDNRLVSGTPGFLGANPAIVLSGPEKGKQVLKDETELGFALLHSLDAKQIEKAIINVKAPEEIITGASRKAILSDTIGILYSALNEVQQKVFLQLLSIYIHRYTPLFAMDMMHDIETAGLANLRFAWAGSMLQGPGNPNYYRIQGPTIIIEYDNTQNNANHVHTVVRDLKNDFGGDELLEHYKQGHQH
ncbi:MAG: DUF3500 domain-containing protein [Ginsengibacter sp.]